MSLPRVSCQDPSVGQVVLLAQRYPYPTPPMASSFFSFEETVHQSPSSKLKLVTRSRLGVSLQNIASSCQSPQELISAGLWITRGNGLHLAVRLELDAYAVTNLQLGHFTDGLSDVLCAAKVLIPSWPQLPQLLICPDGQLWSQLSLRALRAHSATNDLPFYSQSGFVLALSYLESSSKSTQSNRHGLCLPANVHDVRPPPGISTACLDSIEITFRVQALLPSPNPVKGKARSYTRQRRYGDNSRYTLRLRKAISYDEDSNTFTPLLPAENEETVHEHILLVSPRLDCSAHKTEMMLFPNHEPMPGSPNVSTPPPPQPPPFKPLNVLDLIDASLRHTISGTPALTRTTKATPSDVRLKKTSASPSVSSVCPVLFRPGYIKVTSIAFPFFSCPNITDELAANSQIPRPSPPVPPLSHASLRLSQP